MRIRGVCAVVGLLMGGAVFAHAPPQASGAIGHPTGTATGGPIRPRLAERLTSGSSGSDGYELSLVPGFTSAGTIVADTPVLYTEAVFLGAEWLDLDFAGDSVSGLDSFYEGYDGSNYSTLTSEYTENWIGGNSRRPLPTDGIHYGGHIIDPHPFIFPEVADVGVGAGAGNRENAELAAATTEICTLVGDGRLRLHGGNVVNYFPVYASRPRPLGSACAVHGYSQFLSGYCSNTTDQLPALFYATVFFSTAHDSSCDVEDKQTGHSPGLASLANSSARALAEVMTDPAFSGWMDSTGNEIDDKCAWTFNVPFVTFSNGTEWKLQGLWSNTAFDTGTGYLNAEGEKGCVDGH